MQPVDDRGESYFYLFLVDYLAGLSTSYYSSYYSRGSPSAVLSASNLEQSQELGVGPSVSMDDFVGNLVDYYPDTTCEDDESYLKEFPQLTVNQNQSQNLTPIGGLASPIGWDGESSGGASQSAAVSLYSNMNGLQRSRNRRVNQMNRSQDYRDTRYGLSIEHVLSNFTAKEEIDYYCERCKEMKKANMQTSIQKLPDVLILHLKRLVMNTKIRTLVKFPFNDLDLADFLTGNR